VSFEMPEHHQKWLEQHPERSAEWLRERLRDGFDVHHLDGDHGNNTPDNLVLIEHGDHMRLHGLKLDMSKALKNRQASERFVRDTEDPEAIYALRRSGVDYDEIDKLTYVWGSSRRRRMLRANVIAWRYAKANELPYEPIWNIPGFDPRRKRLN